jgi:hypothetical protein
VTAALLAVTVAVLAAGCTAGTATTARRPAPDPRTSRPAPDPRTSQALLRIAAAFNNNYDNGHYGPVYDRWDARSQAILTRADYIRRHQECPAGAQTARTTSASPGPRGAWLVHYEIGGQQLTDYWFYVRRRWVFDLVLSNPQSVRLYRMPARRYLSYLGCSH